MGDNEVVLVTNGTVACTVGTGDTGASLTFLTIGFTHFAIITIASLMYRYILSLHGGGLKVTKNQGVGGSSQK